MNKAYLLIGGNEGELERMNHLQQARENIEKACGSILQQSAVYETAAWGKTDQPAFLNQALLVETGLDAPSCMKVLLAIEEQMGRERTEKYAPRIIDIDILFFNNEIIDLPHVTIPHPEIQNRRFVLQPMDEIAPAYMHPVLNKTIHALLLACKDSLDVKKI